MRKSVIIGIIVIVVVAIGAGIYAALYNPSSTNNTQSSTPAASNSTSTQAAATITYSDSGFSPSITTVKSGDTVAITNTSSTSLQMDSGPHPEHTEDTDLNVGLVSAGQTKTFTVTKKGTFGIHNHFNASDQATVTVQ